MEEKDKLIFDILREMSSVILTISLKLNEPDFAIQERIKKIDFMTVEIEKLISNKEGNE